MNNELYLSMMLLHQRGIIPTKALAVKKNLGFLKRKARCTTLAVISTKGLPEAGRSGEIWSRAQENYRSQPDVSTKLDVTAKELRAISDSFPENDHRRTVTTVARLKGNYNRFVGNVFVGNGPLPQFAGPIIEVLQLEYDRQLERVFGKKFI